MKPLISVIVPTYNVEKYISKCLDSIISQTYENIEIIVVNDGSTDNSLSIVEEYEKKDARIKVFSQKNQGLSAARNTGIDNSKGEYLLFIDSDDYIETNMIEVLENNIRENNADISICDFSWIDENENPERIKDIKIDVYHDKDVMQQLIDRNLQTVVAWNKLYRRYLWDNLRYPVGRIHEDEYVVHLLLDKCSTTVYTNEKLYNYIKHNGTITTSGFSRKKIFDKQEAMRQRFIWSYKTSHDDLLWWSYDLYFYIMSENIKALKAEENEYDAEAKKIMRAGVFRSMPIVLRKRLPKGYILKLLKEI
ncbi:MAG: glycosyltransferase [Cellulosilyticum sp.]|nr:glycosyltransferase [Cellulosilyticum sp.]